MLKNSLAIAPIMLSCCIGLAQAQTAVQTTARTSVMNNMQSATITIESSTCGSTGTCTINQNSAVVGGNAAGSVTTTGSASVSWVQDWGAYVGTTHYACHFTVSIDSQFTAGACHNITASASQKAGPGGLSHPSCQATYAQPIVSDCSNGAVQFSITQ